MRINARAHSYIQIHIYMQTHTYIYIVYLFVHMTFNLGIYMGSTDHEMAKIDHKNMMSL